MVVYILLKIPVTKKVNINPATPLMLSLIFSIDITEATLVIELTAVEVRIS